MQSLDLLTREELESLMEPPSGPAVSIFLPTHRMGAEIQQDPIRLKNLLREAEERLIAEGSRGTEARKLLQPVHELLEERPFWQHQSDGLAVFLAPGLFRTYRLPLAFEELVVVAERFHLKPLLPLLTSSERFFILALSQNEVRFLEATRHSAREVPLPAEVPASLAEALRYDDPERQLQFHTRAPAGHGHGGRAAVYHGHGVGTDDAKENLSRYCHQIDAGLRNLLKERRSPLVVASVEYLFPIYKEANTYSHLVDQALEGNPEGKRAEKLGAAAWHLVEPIFTRHVEEAAEQYNRLTGGERASNEVEEIVPAAYHGRVGLLFVTLGRHQWGNFDPSSNTLRLHSEEEPGDDDLLNLAAIQTFMHGGTVYAVQMEQMPGDAPLAATFRY